MAANLNHEATLLMHSSSAKQPCTAEARHVAKRTLHSLCGELAFLLTTYRLIVFWNDRLQWRQARCIASFAPRGLSSEHNLSGQILLLSRQHPRLRTSLDSGGYYTSVAECAMRAQPCCAVQGLTSRQSSHGSESPREKRGIWRS